MIQLPITFSSSQKFERTQVQSLPRVQPHPINHNRSPMDLKKDIYLFVPSQQTLKFYYLHSPKRLYAFLINFTFLEPTFSSKLVFKNSPTNQEFCEKYTEKFEYLLTGMFVIAFEYLNKDKCLTSSSIRGNNYLISMPQ